MDLTKTQAQWEKAVAQAGSMEERMELFLDSMEDSASRWRTSPSACERSAIVCSAVCDRISTMCG